MLTTGKAADITGGVGFAARIASLIGRFVPGSAEPGSAQRGAMTAFLVRVASAGLLYLSQIVLARWMGGFEYGVYVFVWTWVLVLGGLGNLGMATLMIRLLPEYRERGHLDLLRGLLRAGRFIPLAASTGVAAIAGFALHSWGHLLSSHYLLPAFIALACVPMITLSDLHDGIGRGRGWLAAALLPPYVLRPLLILAGMVVAHEIGWPMSAVTAAGAAVAGTWAAAVVQTVVIQRHLSKDVPPGPRETSVARWLATSLPLLAISFAEIMLQTTDVLIVSQLMTPRDVGIYFAAAKTMSLVMFVHYAVGSAMANRFATLNARGDRNGLALAIREAVNWTFWPSLAGATVILLLGKPLLWLFGPQFADGYPVMMVLVLGFLARAAAGPSEFILNMLGEQRATACVAIFAALLNIGLCLLFVPHFGILGAATATASALVCAASLNAIVARMRLGLSIAIWSNVGKA